MLSFSLVASDAANPVGRLYPPQHPWGLDVGKPKVCTEASAQPSGQACGGSGDPPKQSSNGKDHDQSNLAKAGKAPHRIPCDGRIPTQSRVQTQLGYWTGCRTHGPCKIPRDSPSVGLDDEETRSNHGKHPTSTTLDQVAPVIRSPQSTDDPPRTRADNAASLSIKWIQREPARTQGQVRRHSRGPIASTWKMSLCRPTANFGSHAVRTCSGTRTTPARPWISPCLQRATPI